MRSPLRPGGVRIAPINVSAVPRAAEPVAAGGTAAPARGRATAGFQEGKRTKNGKPSIVRSMTSGRRDLGVLTRAQAAELWTISALMVVTVVSVALSVADLETVLAFAVEDYAFTWGSRCRTATTPIAKLDLDRGSPAASQLMWAAASATESSVECLVQSATQAPRPLAGLKSRTLLQTTPAVCLRSAWAPRPACSGELVARRSAGYALPFWPLGAARATEAPAPYNATALGPWQNASLLPTAPIVGWGARDIAITVVRALSTLTAVAAAVLVVRADALTLYVRQLRNIEAPSARLCCDPFGWSRTTTIATHLVLVLAHVPAGLASEVEASEGFPYEAYVVLIIVAWIRLFAVGAKTVASTSSLSSASARLFTSMTGLEPSVLLWFKRFSLDHRLVLPLSGYVVLMFVAAYWLRAAETIACLSDPRLLCAPLGFADSLFVVGTTAFTVGYGVRALPKTMLGRGIVSVSAILALLATALLVSELVLAARLSPGQDLVYSLLRKAEVRRKRRNAAANAVRTAWLHSREWRQALLWTHGFCGMAFRPVSSRVQVESRALQDVQRWRHARGAVSRQIMDLDVGVHRRLLTSFALLRTEELLEALEKALRAVPTEELVAVRARWHGLDSVCAVGGGAMSSASLSELPSLTASASFASRDPGSFRFSTSQERRARRASKARGEASNGGGGGDDDDDDDGDQDLDISKAELEYDSEAARRRWAAGWEGTVSFE